MSQIQRLRALRTRVNRDVGRRDRVGEQVRSEETSAGEFEARADKADKASQVVQAATEARRQELHERVESLITRGLAAVFPDKDYEFAFRLSLARDVIGVVPVIRSSGPAEDSLETEIVGARAGGIADVCAFLLRVVVLSLARPRVAPFLILDESFSHVSPDYLRGVANLLRELNTSAGIQFVLVTHKDELLDAADVIYRARLTPEGLTEFALEHDLRDEVYHRRPRRGEDAPDRHSAFDGQDLASPESSAEQRYSETTDVLARRQRKQSELRKRQSRRRKK